jgi:hypothetical protein
MGANIAFILRDFPKNFVEIKIMISFAALFEF